MKRFLIIASTGLAGIASPVLAGNLEPVAPTPSPVAAPLPAPVYDWTGFFVGAQVGYADVTADTGAGEIDDDGTSFGVRVGYDFDLGQYVLGGIVQYDETDVTLDTGAAAIEVENVLRVGARAGYDAGRALLYGTAGYAQASTDTIGDADGYFAGVGAEYFVTEPITVGAEALYHDFDDFDGAVGVDGDATTLGLNVNYRF